jgi:hypothetical protein
VLNREAAGLKLWTNMVKAWSQVKKNTRFQGLQNEQDLKSLPIRTPSLVHKLSKEIGCKTNIQKELRAAGFNTMGDVLNSTGELLTCEDL